MNEIGLVKGKLPEDELSYVQLVKHGGISYLQFLRHLGRARLVRNYLEIGTREGKSLRELNCPSIAIDPKFQVISNAIGEKNLCFFFQMSSDEFFNKYDPSNFLGEQVHVAFLDGLHLFENLLRDFINTERHARRESIIFLHDCLPLNFEMAERKKDSAKRKNQELKNYWTGDVWKVLPILRRFRPDLNITLLDATPTGLVMITNLDPTQSILSENYHAALAMGNDELNTVSSYSSFIQSSMILSASEYVSTGRLDQMIR